MDPLKALHKITHMPRKVWIRKRRKRDISVHIKSIRQQTFVNIELPVKQFRFSVCVNANDSGV